jgi:hypothetical protein
MDIYVYFVIDGEAFCYPARSKEDFLKMYGSDEIEWASVISWEFDGDIGYPAVDTFIGEDFAKPHHENAVSYIQSEFAYEKEQEDA